MNDYERKIGEDGLVYLNKEVIEKQRAVAGFLVKKFALNLIKGKSIMNISLPINIFDVRSLLELLAFQYAYSSILLETAGLCSDPIEKIKYSTAFAITKFHLSGAQMKPFNPILGETFQAKIGNSNYYLEQTCHHPPVSNFYITGENYKIYGYNESEASTGANSVKAYYKGNFIVEFSDGTKNKIIFPTFKVDGTMAGTRAIKFRGVLQVIDEKNDLLVHVNLDPDDRGLFKKMVAKKTTYPDYFKGILTSISTNAKFDKKEKVFHINHKDKNIIAEVKGEFTKNVNFGEDTYWEYNPNEFPGLKRMKLTLPSDSTFREDIIWLKKKDEDMAQKFKTKLEESQRYDRKLRASCKQK